jgi:hypothetical protein
MRVAGSIDADHRTRMLDQIVRERGAGTELVRMDNGPDRLVLAGSAVDISRPPCACRRHCGDERTSASNR